jgi:hypothetical protein
MPHIIVNIKLLDGKLRFTITHFLSLLQCNLDGTDSLTQYRSFI